MRSASPYPLPLYMRGRYSANVWPCPFTRTYLPTSHVTTFANSFGAVVDCCEPQPMEERSHLYGSRMRWSLRSPPHSIGENVLIGESYPGRRGRGDSLARYALAPFGDDRGDGGERHPFEGRLPLPHR